ncbi:MAG: Tm-1-like ATP-binding domain-containing protein [Anaerolineales bacterium]|nr:Tm-1-like ATP-binding domain-containing protein [Anaerolineales bacterium]
MAEFKIVVLATLDTKGVEAQFLREQIEKMGAQAMVVDVGVVGAPSAHADVSRQEVAEAGGTPLSELLVNPDREVAAPIMANGARNIVTRLAEAGKVHGIVAMGGTQGTTLATHVMRALPYGFPKIMVSTMASGNVAPWVDIKDITMMYSVTDILGLNPVMRTILANAAGAAVGMARANIPMESTEKPLIGVTTVGITTIGAMKAIEVLEAAGYETIVFHAVGTGGRAMEQLMEEGVIGAVLDYSTIEVSNEMFGALLAGGDKRLTTAGRLGLPQVLCSGAIEVLVYNEPETVPPPFNERKLIRHSPQITDVRLNGEEMARVGAEIARRLQHTTDKAYFMIPTAGYDSYAVEGEGFHDPDADQAFVEALKAGLPLNIEVLERETHIDDPVFATEAAQLLIQLIEAKDGS